MTLETKLRDVADRCERLSALLFAVSVNLFKAACCLLVAGLALLAVAFCSVVAFAGQQLVMALQRSSSRHCLR